MAQSNTTTPTTPTTASTTTKPTDSTANTAGQADYSQQWIEYYRSVGQNELADQIVQQMKEVSLLSINKNSFIFSISVWFDNFNHKCSTNSCNEFLGSVCSTMGQYCRI
jgi:hypothetical protein